jgi:hypothetical protein
LNTSANGRNPPPVPTHVVGFLDLLPQLRNARRRRAMPTERIGKIAGSFVRAAVDAGDLCHYV